MHAAHNSCMVIDFRPDGGVEAMHRDAFDLSFLGSQKIRRATDIRHDDDTQLWDIYLNDHSADGPDSFVLVNEGRGFATYDEARRMEVRWLEMCRLHSFKPRSEAGLSILSVLRASFD